MIIRDRCQHCYYQLSVPQDFLGKRLVCPNCGKINKIQNSESGSSPSGGEENPPSPDSKTAATPSTSVKKNSPKATSHSPSSQDIENSKQPPIPSSPSSPSKLPAAITRKKSWLETKPTFDISLSSFTAFGEFCLFSAYLLASLFALVGVLVLFLPNWTWIGKMIAMLLFWAAALLGFLLLRSLAFLFEWFSESSQD
ncbi:MAG: hypothetical protein D6805_03375 [Planctomycetota bacterium]|nr:MAG: hypothetical protein D6805_03375 [Planctomycetota bacterium]